MVLQRDHLTSVVHTGTVLGELDVDPDFALIELLQADGNPNLTNGLEQVRPLDPERSAVVPRREACRVASFVLVIGPIFLIPATEQSLMKLEFAESPEVDRLKWGNVGVQDQHVPRLASEHL